MRSSIICCRRSPPRCASSTAPASPIAPSARRTCSIATRRGMAMPPGRGIGSPADDLYALCATIAFLMFGKSAVAELSDEQLLAEKIGRGSYATLLGGARLAGPIIEVLRGLLADDPRERWAVQDLEMWLEGRRQVPRQP